MPLRHWSTGNDGVAKRPMPSMGLAMPSLPWTRASGWRRRDFIALSFALLGACDAREAENVDVDVCVCSIK